MKNIVIVIPKLNSSGPISGAIALANILSKKHHVTLLSLQHCFDSHSLISKEVDYVCFAGEKLIRSLRGVRQCCQSADVIFAFCFLPEVYLYILGMKNKAISSVREIRYDNYIDTYGIVKGRLVAFIHNFISTQLRSRIVMNAHMAKQFPKGIVCHVTPNFIDEPKSISRVVERDTPIIGVVGALEERKSPHLILEALINMVADTGIQPSGVTYFGDGSLKNLLIDMVTESKLSNVQIISDETDKERIFSSFDIFVHPSHSEGMSRALLEALYYKKFCIIRDIPQHQEFKGFKNILFFKEDSELPSCIAKALMLLSHREYGNDHITLLPNSYLATGAEEYYLQFIQRMSDDTHK